MINPANNRRLLSGAGLPEVLVALLLLSVGMLSMTTLLTRTIGLARSDLQARALARAEADLVELAALQSHMTPELYEDFEQQLQAQQQTPQAATR